MNLTKNNSIIQVSLITIILADLLWMGDYFSIYYYFIFFITTTVYVSLGVVYLMRIRNHKATDKLIKFFSSFNWLVIVALFGLFFSFLWKVYYPDFWLFFSQVINIKTFIFCLQFFIAPALLFWINLATKTQATFSKTN